MDSVKFIGYKNAVVQKPRQQPPQQQYNQNTNPMLPLAIKSDDPGNNLPPFLWIILTVSAIVSIFGATLYHQYRKIQSRYLLEKSL